MNYKNNAQNPYKSNNWNQNLKIGFSSFVINRCLHSEPNTKNSTKNRERPKRFFAHAPLLINGFYLINPHNGIRKNIYCHQKKKKFTHKKSISKIFSLANFFKK